MNMDTSKTEPENIHNIYHFQNNFSHINMNMDTSNAGPQPIQNLYHFQQNYSHINMNMDTNKFIHKHTPTHNFKTFKNDFQKLDGNIQHFDGNIDMSLITKYNYNFNLFNYKPIHKQNTIDNHFVNYPILKTKTIQRFTKYITRKINNNNIIFYSGTPNIIEKSINTFHVTLRWNNYYIQNNYKNQIKYICKEGRFFSFNSRFNIDFNFKKITDEGFEDYKFHIKNNIYKYGIEDIRIFKFNDEYYYIGTSFINNTDAITSYKCDINEQLYEFKKNIILPTFYDLNLNIKEKNWVFVNYKNQLCIIYKWFPLQIGKICYDKNTMDIIEIKKNIPQCFENARGSSCGYTKNNEIWFIVHKVENIINKNTRILVYRHFFTIFDLNMDLIRYSELFKLDSRCIEFCTGLIVQDDCVILSYSVLDCESYISIYDINHINNDIKWVYCNTHTNM